MKSNSNFIIWIFKFVALVLISLGCLVLWQLCQQFSELNRQMPSTTLFDLLLWIHPIQWFSHLFLSMVLFAVGILIWRTRALL